MKAPAFQFYAGDFLSSTTEMSNEEVGAYIRLLCHQWEKDGIPNDKERIGRMAGAIAGPSLGYVLAKFRLCEDGLLRNDRLEEVRKAQEEFRAIQSQKGRNGANKRWKNSTCYSTGNGTGIAEPIAGLWPEDSSPSPSPSNTPIVPLKGTEKGQLQKRAEAIFHRRESTPLTESEQRAFKKSKAAIEATSEDDWRLLEAFYALPQSETYARKDLASLLNNWNGEIDRARAYKPKAGAQISAKLPIPEPEAWRAWLKDRDDLSWRETAEKREWSEMPRHWQEFILKGMQRGP